MERQDHQTTKRYRIETILTVAMVVAVVFASALVFVAVAPASAAPGDETPTSPEDGPILGENGTLMNTGDDDRTDDGDDKSPKEQLRSLDPSVTGPAPLPAQQRASVASVSAADASADVAGEPVTSCRVIDSPGRYTLTKNIRNSGEDVCIEITSSYVVFDGNGFTIDGVDGGLNTFGVLVNGSAAPLSNVTVTNLRVTDWQGGIAYLSTSDGRIANNTALSNAIGIALAQGSTNNDLQDNTANANLVGIGLVASSNNDLTDNTANENLNGSNVLSEVAGSGIVLTAGSNDNTLAENTANDNSNVGIYLVSSSGNELTHNEANGNDDTNAAGDFPGSGIVLDAGSQDNTLSANTVRSNDLGGIVINASDRNVLTDNIANDNSLGIGVLRSSGNDLTDNTANDNRVGIILAIDATNNDVTDNTANDNVIGIALSTGATNNDLTGNTVKRSVTGTFQGAAVAGDGIVLRDATNNDLTDNVVTDSEGDGISLFGDSSENLIYDNLFHNQNNVNLTGLDIQNNSNDWNVGARQETNVIGGSVTAGNFYANDFGTGFSQACPNNDDRPQLCDIPNDFGVPNNDNNVDYLPLAAVSDPEPEPPTQNTLRIEGTGEFAFYSLRATGDVDGQSLTGEDTVSGTSASGAVGPGADTFTFEGDLRNLYVQEGAKVFLNGNQIDPDTYESVVSFEGDGSYSAYTFTVKNGEITDTQSLTGEDSVTDDHAEGAVRPGADSYTFTGTFAGLDTDGDAAVVLNGLPVDPSMFSNSITFKGTGSYASYEFTVTGEVKGGKYVDSEDSFSGNHGQGAVRAGPETYYFTGTLENIDTTGNVTVIRDGEEVTQN